LTLPKNDTPLNFLAQAQRNAKLSARVEAAVVRGNRVTAEEVLEIAREFGYTFTRVQFERDVKEDIVRRFNEGDASLADVAAMIETKKPKPVPSSCADGCLSYTKSWHPSRLP
jgi:Nif11 domain